MLTAWSHQHSRLWGQRRKPPLGGNTREGKAAVTQPSPRRQMSLHTGESGNRRQQKGNLEPQNDLGA